MRTKTLLVTAALSVAGIATSMAQVYSVNAVGYVNVPVSPGFNLIANQLNRTGGNTLNALFSGVSAESQVFKYVASNGSYTADIYDGANWLYAETGDPSVRTLSPGEGAFFYLAGATAQTITLVGEVPQGDVGLSLTPGFSLVSSKVPQSVPIDTIGVPAVVESLFLTYNATVQGYNIALINDGTDWLHSETGVVTPATPKVAEGFFFYNPSATVPIAWVRTFSVNP
jgi:hypothetical protein